MSIKRRARIAGLAGLLLSVALYLLSRASGGLLFYWPQTIGFYVTMLLRGVHTASKADFVIIGIPTNSVVYASVVFVLTSLVARRKTSN
jgi:hypothetical protein